MNIRAKCVNKDCKAYNIEKSVFVGTLLGFGAKNERVKCPSCGKLMRTTKSVAVTPRGASGRSLTEHCRGAVVDAAADNCTGVQTLEQISMPMGFTSTALTSRRPSGRSKATHQARRNLQWADAYRTQISDQTGLALSPEDVAALYSQCQSVSPV